MPYYIKGLMKEGGGGDNFKIGMQMDGGQKFMPIPESMFASEVPCPEPTPAPSPDPTPAPTTTTTSCAPGVCGQGAWVNFYGDENEESCKELCEMSRPGQKLLTEGMEIMAPYCEGYYKPIMTKDECNEARKESE